MSDAALRRELACCLDDARVAMLRAIEDLSDAQLTHHAHPEFSPIGWHVGHVIWQEELWVSRGLAQRPAINPDLDRVYDPRALLKSERAVALPPRAELLAYAVRVREQTQSVLATTALAGDPLREQGHVFRFLANHERQHTEIIGTVRLAAAFSRTCPPARSSLAAARGRAGRMPIPAGDVEIGSCGDADAWDNELPSHRQHVPALLLARDPVTAGEWLAFMAARGYDDERLWCAPGWRWRCTSEARAPLYWRRDRSGTWLRRTPFGERCVEVAEPVAHISWYEASAFARFAGARLPSEAEWETAASWDSVAAVKHRYPWGADAERPGVANWNNAHGDLTGIGCHPAGASPHGTEDMMGQVWEWVASAFSPYPGFAPQAYAEYSAPWFDGAHRVARGGSYLTAPSTARAAFRNWYLPHVREPVLGARLAWSAA